MTVSSSPAVNTRHLRSISEPRPDESPSQRTRRKQVARIICHLRDQIKSQYPQLIMPSNWMITCLVYNTWTDTHAPHDWQAMVMQVLLGVRSSTNVGLDKACNFVCIEKSAPLFPNEELFEEWDAYRFSQALLAHLDRELN